MFRSEHDLKYFRDGYKLCKKKRKKRKRKEKKIKTMEKCVTIPTERIASDHYLDAIKDHGVMAPLRNDLLRVIARRWHFKAALQRPMSRLTEGGDSFPLETSNDVERQ